MARKVKDVRITTEGRDKGKWFRITEVPALQAERWAMRLLLACGRVGLDIPMNPSQDAFDLLLQQGLGALLRMHPDDAQPLLDEMLGCIRVIRDVRHPEGEFTLMDGDIEEVRTLLQLRQEIIALHTNFSLPGAQSDSTL